ncbi:MAG TPA: hypothetical protein VN963_00485, partial [bacterium]|nr:hypothetical protein [bacterium]
MKRQSSGRRKALVVAYNYLLNDPPARQAAGSLAKAGYETTVLQSPSYATFPTPPPPGVRAVEYKCPEKGGGIKSVIRWLDFQKALARETQSFGPGDVVVTFMLHSLAAL